MPPTQPVSPPVIVWLRQDLRISDNPALHAAVETGSPVIILYVLDETMPWPPGGAGRWWLHHSLERLGAALKDLGATLVLRRGDGSAALDDVVKISGASAVFWNRCHEPAWRARDAVIEADLRNRGVFVTAFEAGLLFPPGSVRTGAGKQFKVFTPFWRALTSGPEPAFPLPGPARIDAYGGSLAGDDLDSWHLLPTSPDWAGGIREVWDPGEAGARDRLWEFLEVTSGGYDRDRDFPGLEGTSRLSPHLHWGEISPRQIWHATRMHLADKESSGIGTFLKEVGWREFSYNLLHDNPDLPERPLDRRFERFPWRRDPQMLRAWQCGRTGYPVVDAGMRQLWQTGWMHNRVRMIVGSFLIKHLLTPWQDGEAWFWDTLVDADLASNSASWQWIAGCGADASPFFRIFNPVLQGEKFDPEGGYVRRFVPEISDLPKKYIHKPWEAPEDVLRQAGIDLGETYPRPIVDHREARERALAAFRSIGIQAEDPA